MNIGKHLLFLAFAATISFTSKQFSNILLLCFQLLIKTFNFFGWLFNSLNRIFVHYKFLYIQQSQRINGKAKWNKMQWRTRSLLKICIRVTINCTNFLLSRKKWVFGCKQTVIFVFLAQTKAFVFEPGS